MKTLIGSIISAMILASIFEAECFGQSPGDTIGFTQFPYQTSGPSGRRIVIDNQRNVHFAWTDGSALPETRNIRYNCVGQDLPSPWPEAGTIISYRIGSQLVQLAVNSENRAVCVWQQRFAGADSLIVASDQYMYFGEFYYKHPPNRLDNIIFKWPYIAVDRNDRYQVVATSDIPGDYRPFGYSRSNNGGTTWTVLAAVDTIRQVSPIIVSSRVSGKVAIVYTHPADTSASMNDIYYIQSPDGITWNGFSQKINITNYRMGDSLYALKDVSAAFDFNDNLQIIWNAYSRNPQPGRPSDYLYHFDVTSGTIHSITESAALPAMGCNPFGENAMFSKPTIAVDSANGLYVAYTSWDSSDCSRDGYANGEIYLQRSFNCGETWTVRENLTNSHSPDCYDGNCYSDIWPTLAEQVDNFVHLFYECNREGLDRPLIYYLILYLKIPAGSQQNEENGNLSSGFAFTQNYPNPFNAQTTLAYALGEKSEIKLSVFNIIGQRIITLATGLQDAGLHKLIWNAKNIPSGVYYARLEAGEGSQTVKMVLLK